MAITAEGTQVAVSGTSATSVIINVPSGAVTDDIILVSGVTQGTSSWFMDAALTTIFNNSESGGLHAEQFVAYYRVPASSPAASFTLTRTGTVTKGYVAGARILRGVENTGSIVVATGGLGASLHTNTSDFASGGALAAAYTDAVVLMCAAVQSTTNTEVNAPSSTMTSPVTVIGIGQTTGTTRWGVHIVLGVVTPAAEVTTRMLPIGSNTTPTHFCVGRQVALIAEPPAVANNPPTITATPTSKTLMLGQSSSIFLSASDPEDDAVSFSLQADPFSGGVATVIDNGNNTASLSLSTNWRNHAQVGGPSNVVVRANDGNGNIVDTNVPVTVTDTVGRTRIGGTWRPVTMPFGIGVQH